MQDGNALLVTCRERAKMNHKSLDFQFCEGKEGRKEGKEEGGKEIK